MKGENKLRRTIAIAKPVLGREEVEAVRRVFESGVLVPGQRIRLFEKAFAEYVGVEHAVAVANGTVALDIALKALRISPGYEVITSAFSFIASSNCVLFQGQNQSSLILTQEALTLTPRTLPRKLLPRQGL